MQKYFVKIIISVLVLSAFYIAPCFSESRLRLGKLKIEPKINYQAKYHDNIYLDASNKDSDLIHTFSPEILMGYDGKTGNYIKAGYKSEVVVYSSDSKNNYETHLPFLKLGYKSPRGFYVKAENKYRHTKEPYSDEEAYKLGERVERWNNTGDLTVGYEFAKKYALELLYTNFLLRYHDDIDIWQDRSEKAYGLVCLYNLPGNKTSLFAEYRETHVIFDGQNNRNDGWNSNTSQDHDLKDYSIGARFNPGSKINGEIKLGIGEQEFENHHDKNNITYRDNQSWIASTNVTYTPTPKTKVSMNLSRSYETSWQQQSNGYSNTNYGLNLRQKFTAPLFLITGLNWNHKNFKQYSYLPNKIFDDYAFDVGLEYQPQTWLLGMLKYEYETRDVSHSYYKDDEYSVNTFLAGLGITF